MTEGTVAVRSRKTGDMGSMTPEEFLAMAQKQIDEKSRDN